MLELHACVHVGLETMCECVGEEGTRGTAAEEQDLKGTCPVGVAARWWTIRMPERRRRWDSRKCPVSRSVRSHCARRSRLETFVLYERSVLFSSACFTPSPVDTRIEVVLSRLA